MAGYIEKRVTFRVRGPQMDRRLIQNYTCYLNGGVNIVPLGGNVFVGNLKISCLPRFHGRSSRQKKALPVAQNNLIEGVMKFEGDFNLLDLAVATVPDRSED